MYVYDRRIINDTCIYIYIESIFLLYTHILAYRPIEAIVRVPCWAPQLYLQAKTPEEQLAQEAAVPGATGASSLAALLVAPCCWSTRRSPSPPTLGHAARARPRPRGAAWAGSASYSRPRGGSVVEGGSIRAKGFSPPQGVSRPQGRSLLRGGSPSRGGSPEQSGSLPQGGSAARGCSPPQAGSRPSSSFLSSGSGLSARSLASTSTSGSS